MSAQVLKVAGAVLNKYNVGLYGKDDDDNIIATTTAAAAAADDDNIQIWYLCYKELTFLSYH